ncbi:hypothetical protein BC936DRAFT_139618 [Jimgerdemannia flammicorona]|uniref:Uncharacterized protein n=1 Tax=Jimgerdemannia flammicorona TaxID=994334 RepID=A0A433B9J3_9FUNG|nr:hypothetical protein BC936DRAFT_139618 [Jimgerdemannia flammicorona]
MSSGTQPPQSITPLQKLASVNENTWLQMAPEMDSGVPRLRVPSSVLSGIRLSACNIAAVKWKPEARRFVCENLTVSDSADGSNRFESERCFYINCQYYSTASLHSLCETPFNRSSNFPGNLAELMMDFDRAMSCYESALRHNPYSIPALTQIASLFRIREQFARAVDYFKRILHIQDNNGDIWGALGHCYLMMDNLQDAYHAYQQALYHLPNPREPKLWYGIGILYDRYGSLEHAEEAFSAVMKMEPKFEKANEIYFRLGIIYKQQQKYDLSLQCFKYIIPSPPRPLTEVDIWFQIGHVYEQQKEYQLAREAYERVLNENPEHAKVLQQLGWLYHQQTAAFANQDLAISYLTRSLKSDGNDAQSWYLLGRCYMAQSNYNKAYEAYQQAVYRDARNPTFWCSIGVLYYQINQYRDALDAYSRAIRLNPYISEVWYDLGTLYESCNNQIQDALDAYQRAAELDPTNPHIKQRLELLRKAQQAGGPTSAPLPTDVNPAAYLNGPNNGPSLNGAGTAAQFPQPGPQGPPPGMASYPSARQMDNRGPPPMSLHHAEHPGGPARDLPMPGRRSPGAYTPHQGDLNIPNIGGGRAPTPSDRAQMNPINVHDRAPLQPPPPMPQTQSQPIRQSHKSSRNENMPSPGPQHHSDIPNRVSPPNSSVQNARPPSRAQSPRTQAQGHTHYMSPHVPHAEVQVHPGHHPMHHDQQQQPPPQRRMSDPYEQNDVFQKPKQELKTNGSPSPYSRHDMHQAFPMAHDSRTPPIGMKQEDQPMVNPMDRQSMINPPPQSSPRAEGPSRTLTPPEEERSSSSAIRHEHRRSSSSASAQFAEVKQQAGESTRLDQYALNDQSHRSSPIMHPSEARGSGRGSSESGRDRERERDRERDRDVKLNSADDSHHYRSEPRPYDTSAVHNGANQQNGITDNIPTSIGRSSSPRPRTPSISKQISQPQQSHIVSTLPPSSAAMTSSRQVDEDYDESAVDTLMSMREKGARKRSLEVGEPDLADNKRTKQSVPREEGYAPVVSRESREPRESRDAPSSSGSSSSTGSGYRHHSPPSAINAAATAARDATASPKEQHPSPTQVTPREAIATVSPTAPAPTPAASVSPPPSKAQVASPPPVSMPTVSSPKDRKDSDSSAAAPASAAPVPATTNANGSSNGNHRAASPPPAASS